MQTATASTIQGFPKHRLDAARSAIAKAHARFVRAAAKAGQDAPIAPTVRVVRERVESVCSSCKVFTDGFAGGTCIACRRGYMQSFAVLDLELVAARPSLAGWDFLAVVEPLTGGNLIRQVPAADVAEGELAAWRTADALVCQHCNASRKRIETFVLRANGDDPAIAKGTYKQVGRNCLKVFLGGKSADAILASFGWAEIFKVAGDGDEEGGGGGRGGSIVYDPLDFMAWCTASVRLLGFTSKKAAFERGVRSTSDHVDYLTTMPWGSEAIRIWTAAREEFKPTDADKERALAALEWAKALPEDSDYNRNLALVARQPILDPKHAGIMASAVSGYARVLGEAVQRKMRETTRGTSAHLGELGEKNRRDFGVVTLERHVVFETDIGPLHIHAFRDASGNLIVWKTGKPAGEPGDTFELVARLKAHTEFKGEKQTEISRANLTKTNISTNAAKAG